MLEQYIKFMAGGCTGALFPLEIISLEDVYRASKKDLKRGERFWIRFSQDNTNLNRGWKKVKWIVSDFYEVHWNIIFRPVSQLAAQQ